jgi:hypothetical protein
MVQRNRINCVLRFRTPAGAPSSIAACAAAHPDRPMALPPAAPDRQPRHGRRIDVQVFARPDGLWEVDATLTDTKARDWPLARGLLPAGTPLHEMLLRLVVDRDFEIVAAGAETRWMPYDGQCDTYGDAYQALVGLNLMRGFRRAVQERLGGVRGCTHITELTQLLPTAVVQAFAGEVLPVDGAAAGDEPPFQLDRCHALRREGEVVRLHYPRWYRGAAVAQRRPRAELPVHEDAGPAG